MRISALRIPLAAIMNVCDGDINTILGDEVVSPRKIFTVGDMIKLHETEHVPMDNGGNKYD